MAVLRGSPGMEAGGRVLIEIDATESAGIATVAIVTEDDHLHFVRLPSERPSLQTRLESERIAGVVAAYLGSPPPRNPAPAAGRPRRAGITRGASAGGWRRPRPEEKIILFQASTARRGRPLRAASFFVLIIPAGAAPRQGFAIAAHPPAHGRARPRSAPPTRSLSARRWKSPDEYRILAPMDGRLGMPVRSVRDATRPDAGTFDR